EREHPPAIGSVITYRYQELSEAGVPRFPTFVAVRHDFAWPPKPAVAAPSPAPEPARVPVPALAPEPPAKADQAPAPARPPAPAEAPSPKAPSKPEEPARPVAPMTPAKPVRAGAKRRFELVEGGSSKFWEIQVTGSAHKVRYGRIGAPGAEKTK